MYTLRTLFTSYTYTSLSLWTEREEKGHEGHLFFFSNCETQYPQTVQGKQEKTKSQKTLKMASAIINKGFHTHKPRGKFDSDISKTTMW